MNHLTNSRRAGVLLHLTSLPAEEGLGKMGENAWRFVDWLADCGFTVWQILPLGPTHADKSPYLSPSAFAGNPDLISIHRLLEDVALGDSWLGKIIKNLEEKSIVSLHAALLKADPGFRIENLPGGDEFLKDNNYWLVDYARFTTLKASQRKENGRSPGWWEWPEGLRHHDTTAINGVLDEHREIYQAVLIEQYLFERQWQSLKNYANSKGIELFGDIPLYVAHDSVDVWANQRYFALGDTGQPTEVAGVPPDMFSEDGQVWGNPVYNWKAMMEDGFSWWISRIRRQLSLVDLVRIDHFRGLQAYWSIPVPEDDSEIIGKDGSWVETPGHELLQSVQNAMGELPLIAEDLGYITAEVDELREAFKIPCMRVLQFGFDGSTDNPHLHSNLEQGTAFYTGTHDNDTVLSWFNELHVDAQAWIRSMLDISEDASIVDAMLRTVLESKAALVILPLQDILHLGEGNRMNKPGTIEGNWVWQFEWNQLDQSVTIEFQQLLKLPSVNRFQ